MGEPGQAYQRISWAFIGRSQEILCDARFFSSFDAQRSTTAQLQPLEEELVISPKQIASFPILFQSIHHLKRKIIEQQPYSGHLEFRITRLVNQSNPFFGYLSPVLFFFAHHTNLINFEPQKLIIFLLKLAFFISIKITS